MINGLMHLDCLEHFLGSAWFPKYRKHSIDTSYYDCLKVDQ